jgi:glycosyltransferase involved in cell wall biosynthesis
MGSGDGQGAVPRAGSMMARTLLSRIRQRGPDQRLSRAVGIVANEFFDPELGRMGGFGWAARTSAECLGARGDLGWRPILLAGRGGLADDKTATSTHGFPLIKFDDDSRRYRRALAQAHVSLFLTIDHRPNYVPVLEARPRTPVIVWVRDPRSPADVAKITTLEIPSNTDPPLGIEPIDLRSLRTFGDVAESRLGRVTFASPAPTLASLKSSETYGAPIAEVELLPNPLDVVPSDVAEHERPRVVFVGRLDPIKRPWLFVELARSFPHVEFLLLGQSHFTGAGSWQPSGLPANVRALGHVGEEKKTRTLRSAWMLVNTSIHESLPISFLEALHCGTPIVACQNPEDVTSRFGVYVGSWDGSGLDGLPAFIDGVERLLGDRDLRTKLGHEGREWARATHTRDEFVSTFARISEAAVHDAD